PTLGTNCLLEARQSAPNRFPYNLYLLAYLGQVGAVLVKFYNSIQLFYACWVFEGSGLAESQQPQVILDKRIQDLPPLVAETNPALGCTAPQRDSSAQDYSPIFQILKEE